MAVSKEDQATVIYLGKATGPTDDVLAAAPYESVGYWLMLAAFLIMLGAAGVLRFKARAPGSGLCLAGLLLVLAYFLFRQTVAQDAELRYGPWADAVELVAYSIGGLVIAIGYARLTFYVTKTR